VARVWSVAIIAWTPLIVHLTGYSDDVLRLLFNSIKTGAELFGEQLAESGAIDVESSSTPTTDTPTSDATSTSELSPGALVLIGGLQIIIALVGVVLALVFTGSFVIAGLFYLAILFNTARDAIQTTTAWRYSWGDPVAQ
jgi:hypothetical protein